VPLAQVVGGYSVYSTGGWQYCYAKRTQCGKDLAASGTVYART
jgi:hypothetical protein